MAGPRTRWSRWREWIEERVRQRATLPGVVFTLVITATGVGAFATGNNLLFLLLALLLSLLMVSGMFNRLNLAGLEIELVTPDVLFANIDTTAQVRVRNTKRFGDSFALHVQGGRRTGLLTRAFFAMVRSRSVVAEPIGLRFERRGLYQDRALVVWSRYPFGFTVRFLPVRLAREMIVFPDTRLGGEWRPYLQWLQDTAARVSRSPGEEWLQVRPYQQGESWKRIDWRASARMSTLHSREDRAPEPTQVKVILDRRGEAKDQEAFERCVQTAAGLCTASIRAGVPVLLQAQNREIAMRSERDLYTGLTYLALVDLDATLPPLAAVSTHTNVFLSAIETPRLPSGVQWSPASGSEQRSVDA